MPSSFQPGRYLILEEGTPGDDEFSVQNVPFFLGSYENQRAGRVEHPNCHTLLSKITNGSHDPIIEDEGINVRVRRGKRTMKGMRFEKKEYEQ